MLMYVYMFMFRGYLSTNEQTQWLPELNVKQ
jgi:hypothetical protein